MAIAKVSLSFARATDGNLVIFGDSVIAKMTGNAEYPSPTPSLASVQTSLTALQNALADAKDGGPAKTAAKNAAREVLLNKLRSLALYVQQECGDDLVALLSSGFEANKALTPAGVPGAQTTSSFSRRARGPDSPRYPPPAARRSLS